MIRRFCKGSKVCPKCNQVLRFLGNKENGTIWYCDSCQEAVVLPIKDNRDTPSFQVDNSDYRNY